VLLPEGPSRDNHAAPKAKRRLGWRCSLFRTFRGRRSGPDHRGYLTENWGWEYIFYVKPRAGRIMLCLWVSLEAKPMNLRCCAWATVGLITMASASARADRLEAGKRRLVWLAHPSSSSCRSRGYLARRVPVDRTDDEEAALNLAGLVRRNFGFGILASFLLGVAPVRLGLWLPVFLSRIPGLTMRADRMGAAWTGSRRVLIRWLRNDEARFERA